MEDHGDTLPGAAAWFDAGLDRTRGHGATRTLDKAPQPLANEGFVQDKENLPPMKHDCDYMANSTGCAELKAMESRLWDASLAAFGAMSLVSGGDNANLG
jgi:hypothetical protein